jgi:hypothetical protein
MLNQSRPDLKIPKESRFLELGIRPRRMSFPRPFRRVQIHERGASLAPAMEEAVNDIAKMLKDATNNPTTLALALAVVVLARAVYQFAS